MRMMVGPVKTVNKDLALQLYYTSLTLYLPPSTLFSFPLRISRCFTCRKSTTCSWSLPHQVLCEFFIMDSVGYRHVHKLWQDVPRTLDLSMTPFAECIFQPCQQVFLAERVSFVNKIRRKRCHFFFFLVLRIPCVILNSFIIFASVCNLTSIVGDSACFMELYTAETRSR